MEEAPVLPAEGDPVRAADHLPTVLPAQLQARAVRHCNQLKQISKDGAVERLFMALLAFF